MYNDEQNLYHYTYRKDGTEPGQRYDAKQPTVDEQLGSYRQQQEQQLQLQEQQRIRRIFLPELLPIRKVRVRS